MKPWPMPRRPREINDVADEWWDLNSSCLPKTKRVNARLVKLQREIVRLMLMSPGERQGIIDWHARNDKDRMKP